jgi:hypothetical protein
LKPTKKLPLICTLIALLIVGLSFFWRKHQADQLAEVSDEVTKLRQVNFANGNKLEDSDIPEKKAPTATEAAANKSSDEQIAAKLSGDDLKNYQTFDAILKSKNDNDPRLDQDLKHQSAAVRNAMIEKYAQLAPEDKNGRGLIAYMISRDAQSAEDLQFMKSVFDQPPCLSLADCKSTGPADPHFSTTNQTTLVYDQKVILFQIEKTLTEHPEYLKDPVKREGFVATLRQAESYGVSSIQQKAQEIRARFGL